MGDIDDRIKTLGEQGAETDTKLQNHGDKIRPMRQTKIAALEKEKKTDAMLAGQGKKKMLYKI